MKAPGLRPLALLAALLCTSGLAGAFGQVPPAERNTRHALVIGIGEYSDPEIPRLKGAVHDVASARRMAAAMAIAPANITVLRDHEATADRIRAEITALNGRVRDGDRVFVYYSGHGTRWYDQSVKLDGCTEGLMASDGRVLSSVELGQRLAPLAQRADKMLVFYDACFSGGVAGAPFRTRGFSLQGEQITPKFTRAGAPEMCAQPSNFRTRSLALVMQQAQAVPQNVVHIAASRPDEVSFDSSTVGGFATAAWRDCLLGQAQDLDGSGAITADEVTRCAQAEVDRALAGQPGILGQQMTVAGNAGFVPAWMGADFTRPAAPVVTASPAAAGPAAAMPPAVAAAVAALTPPGVAVQVPAPAAPLRRATSSEILGEVHGQRDGTRRIVATVRQPVMKIGRDSLDIDVTPQRDGYLYVAMAGSDGRSLVLLYPNTLAPDNRVRAGQRVSLPGAAGWEIVAAGPPGPETLLVMVTDAPRDLGSLVQERSGPFTKTLLDASGRARLQEVLGNGTPAAGCGQPGAAPCSDAFGAALLRVQTVR
ncbi:MAG: caspase family protein [Rubrivivax sp.]|nr:caspase family protein [Rubrivivax sp.]